MLLVCTCSLTVSWCLQYLVEVVMKQQSQHLSTRDSGHLHIVVCRMWTQQLKVTQNGNLLYRLPDGHVMQFCSYKERTKLPLDIWSFFCAWITEDHYTPQLIKHSNSGMEQSATRLLTFDILKGDQVSSFLSVIRLTWRCPFRPSADVCIELCNSFRYKLCKVLVVVVAVVVAEGVSCLMNFAARRSKVEVICKVLF